VGLNYRGRRGFSTPRYEGSDKLNSLIRRGEDSPVFDRTDTLGSENLVVSYFKCYLPTINPFAHNGTFRI